MQGSFIHHFLERGTRVSLGLQVEYPDWSRQSVDCGLYALPNWFSRRSRTHSISPPASGDLVLDDLNQIVQQAAVIAWKSLSELRWPRSGLVCSSNSRLQQ